MRKNAIGLSKYVIGLSFALIAVSNCFNVLSNSSRFISLPADYSAHIEAPKPHERNSILGLLAGANPGANHGLFGSSVERAVAARADLATRASAFSPGTPVVTATKSHTPSGSAQPGDTLTYTVVITNSGTADAIGVNFSDTIDPNTTLVGGSLIASPIAVDDSYHTIGNVNISVPVGQGVIANDLNPNGAGTLTVTKVNATIVPGGGSATASTSNGSVTIGSDGSFSYAPNDAFRGPSDSFTYTLDNGTGKIDTATVTISVNGLIWFVDATAAPGGDGRLATPFNCLVGAGCFDTAAADVTNDNIFVYSGSYTGGLTLLNGEKLIGQGAGDTLLGITGLTAPSGTNLLPATGGANPTISAAGINVTLGSGNTIRGVTLNGTAAAAVDLSGAGFGTVSIAETALGGTGQALNLNNGTLSGPVAATAAFTNISSTNSSSTGISLTSVSGSMSAGSASITNSTGIGISVNTSSAGLNFGATTSTQSGGAGVSLLTNTGAVTFGSLDISPGAAQKGLLATDNSNTITAASGAITTIGAAAVEITRSTGTTPLVVTLTSVSASGGASGIILTNTNGSFTITGDGTNNGSGGTIQNSTNDGISLTNTQNISLTSMSIQNTVHSGINGTQVNNFAFAFGAINNSGTTSLDSNISFNSNPTTASNISGALTVTNSTLTNARFSGLDVEAGDGTVTNANVSNNTITSTTSTGTSQGQGINFVGVNTASTVFKLNKAAIGSNVISNFPSGAGIQINLNASDATGPGATAGVPNDASNTISITNNQVKGFSPTNRIGTNAIIAAISGANSSSRSQGNFDISNNGTLVNPLTNITGTVILIGNNGYATMTATVNNNVIVANHQPNFLGVNGIAGGNGAAGAGNAWTPALSMTVTNNIISLTDGNGILLVGRGTSGMFDLKIANNTVAAPINAGGALRQGIRVDAGNAASGDDAVCLNISGNTSAGSNGAQGIGIRKQGTVATTNDFGITGLSPSPATGAQAATFVASNNPTGGGCDNISGSNFVSCSTAPAMAPIEVVTQSRKETPDAPTADGSVDSDGALWVFTPKNLEADRARLGIDAGQKLSHQQLLWTVQAAIERWREAGISPVDLARLQQVSFEISSLPSGQLATTTSTSISIDETAAGLGWFYDQTPSDDGEFDVPVPGRELQTTEYSPAFGRVDLLTVVMRELGSVYLKGKDRVPKQLRWMMQPLLPASVRRMPVFNVRSASSVGVPSGGRSNLASSAPSQQPKNHLDALRVSPAVFNPSADVMPGPYGRNAKRMSYATARRVAALSPFSGETVNLGVGTIPAGKSVTIMFQVTINNPLPGGVCSVSNQGHVTGTNFSPVDTNIDTASIVTAVVIGACPSNVMTNTAPGVCTAVVTYATPTATGCPAPTVSCSPPSGFAFPKGTTTVTCTATNGTPPDSTCSFTVNVHDNQPPTIGACPSNITTDESPAGSGSATVTYSTPSSSDNCPGQTVNCSPASGSSFAVGTTTVTCTAMDTSGNTASCQFTVTVNSVGLTALSPAKVWIGLKNSDDVGTKFDLLAEVLRNGSVIGSGQLNDVPGGSSGFNNAVLRTITLALSSAVPMGPGDTMSFRLSVRIGATSGHTSGTARLWYNGAAIDSGASRDAGSRFDATIAGSTSDYFLRTSFLLNTTAGSSKTSVDKLVSHSGGNPWVAFGTWSKTF